MPRQYVADDPVKEVLCDIDFVTKTSAGVLVRAVNRRFGFNQVLIEGAAELRYALGPKIKAIYFYDVSRAAGQRWIDLLHLNGPKDSTLIDRNFHGISGVLYFPGVAITTGDILNSWASGDFLYVCFEQPAGGIIPDLSANNGTAATLSGSYSRGDSFTALVTLADNTETAGATLGSGVATGAISGEPITWTPQADWTKSDLRNIILGQADVPSEVGYWVRLATSATLDTTVSLASIYAMAPLTASATARRGRAKATTEYVINLDDTVGGIEFISVAALDSTVDITWIKTRQTS